jgi:hypothetical protein
MSKAKIYYEYIPSYLYIGGEDGEDEVEVN